MLSAFINDKELLYDGKIDIEKLKRSTFGSWVVMVNNWQRKSEG